MNDPTPEMQEYLATARRYLRGDVLARFERDWAALAEPERAARIVEACPVCGCLGRYLIGGYLECRVCRLAKPTVISPETGQGSTDDTTGGGDILK